MPVMSNDDFQYYSVVRKTGEEFAEIIRSNFREDDNGVCTANFSLNWLFLSTSGVHGTYTDLDDIEASDAFRAAKDGNTHESNSSSDSTTFIITAVIFRPRQCATVYGNARFHFDEIPWLRRTVTRTLLGIRTSQSHNLDVNNKLIKSSN